MINPFNADYFMKQALIDERLSAEVGEVIVWTGVDCSN